MQWKSFVHNGVAFPEEYKPKGLSIMIRGELVPLSPPAEEMAVAISKKTGTKYLSDQTFTQNFMSDFVKTLPERFHNAAFADVDFNNIKKALDSEKQDKASIEKPEKRLMAKEKARVKEDLQKKYGVVLIDGKEFKIANWMVEPPGLVFGRGLLPNRGRWKPRLTEQDVILNISPDAPIPAGNWGGVVHETNEFWVAKWRDKISGKMKYVMLHESTPVQIKRNKKKYMKADKLAANIEKVRAEIRAKMTAKDIKDRQLATICYLIDIYGFRIGNEKGEDESQTIGASTLLVKNVKVAGTDVTFDFLGKDSVKFENTYQNVDPVLTANLVEFTKGKGPDDLVFDVCGSNVVNKFLGKITPGLTAKVFRTYKATMTVKEYLDSHPPGKEVYEKKYIAKMANLEAAKALNHKRTLPGKWEEQLKAKEEALKKLQALGEKKAARIKKAELDLDLQIKTRDYNLNTSMRNYINPVVYKKWCDKIGLDWAKLYSKTLQKKFAWVGATFKNSHPGEGTVDSEPEDGGVQATG